MKDRIHWKRLGVALRKYGDVVVEKMKDELQRHGKVATGELINTMSSYTEMEDDKQYLYIDYKKYGDYVDSGRDPGGKGPPFDPVDPIREWIDVRGIRPQGISKDSLAFLIRRKIAIKGIDAAPFLYLFWDHIDDLNDVIADSAREDVENNINDYINNFNKNNK
jgi:hypothetical protein